MRRLIALLVLPAATALPVAVQAATHARHATPPALVAATALAAATRH
jgi:hypothetical protein